MRDAELAASYDAVPYESRPLRPTHPSNLAVMAHLAGFSPPDLRGCRVLEIGCATGGNLLPLADSLPGAHLVGIDLAASQIAIGQRVVRELGLENVELRAASILDVDFAPGSFDYIICHGVYSWVPEAVQVGILAACGRWLSSSGVAYVSYNTYPGWHLRSMVRDMLHYRVRDIAAPRARIQACREFLVYLLAYVRDRDSAFGKAVFEEATLIAEASDTYVFHEHLELDNRPVYFHQVAAAARQHGLEYVSEAEARDHDHDGGEGDIRIAREQERDFLGGTTFRRSLLRRADAPRVGRTGADRITSLWLASAAQPERDAVDVEGQGVEVFVGQGGQKLSIQHPWLKAAFVLLGARWPEATPFADLAAEIAQRLGGPPPPEAMDEILGSLRVCHAGGVLALDPCRGVATSRPGDRPTASAHARLMAREARRVSSLRHNLVEVREVDRQLLLLLDGTRDRAALASALAHAARAQAFTLPNDPRVAVEESLGILRMAALLRA